MLVKGPRDESWHEPEIDSWKAEPASATSRSRRHA
jgi:hypothetical protein